MFEEGCCLLRHCEPARERALAYAGESNPGPPHGAAHLGCFALFHGARNDDGG